MSESQQIETNKLWLYGIAIIIATTIINVVIFLIADSAGSFDGVINTQFDAEITVVEVIVSATFQPLIGLVLFFVLTSISDRPIYLFRIIATIALILSFALPFTLQDYTTGSIIALELMHIVSGLGLIVVLPYLLTRE